MGSRFGNIVTSRRARGHSYSAAEPPAKGTGAAKLIRAAWSAMHIHSEVTGAVLAAGAALLSASGALAAEITVPATSMTTLASAATFPTATIGSDGYALYQTAPSTNTFTTGTNVLVKPTYVAGILVNTTYTPYPGTTTYPYSQLTVNGTKEFTGIYYAKNIPDGSLSSTPVASITLSSSSSSIPGEFQLGILSDNGSSNGLNGSSFIVYDDQGTGNATSATVADTPATAHNGFYFFDISDAAASDVITIYETGGTSDYVSIGGVTFDTLSSTPEPASLGVLSLSSFALLLRRRRGLGRNPKTGRIQ